MMREGQASGISFLRLSALLLTVAAILVPPKGGNLVAQAQVVQPPAVTSAVTERNINVTVEYGYLGDAQALTMRVTVDSLSLATALGFVDIRLQHSLDKWQAFQVSTLMTDPQTMCFQTAESTNELQLLRIEPGRMPSLAYEVSKVDFGSYKTVVFLRLAPFVAVDGQRGPPKLNISVGSFTLTTSQRCSFNTRASEVQMWQPHDFDPFSEEAFMQLSSSACRMGVPSQLSPYRCMRCFEPWGPSGRCDVGPPTTLPPWLVDNSTNATNTTLNLTATTGATTAPQTSVPETPPPVTEEPTPAPPTPPADFVWVISITVERVVSTDDGAAEDAAGRRMLDEAAFKNAVSLVSRVNPARIVILHREQGPTAASVRVHFTFEDGVGKDMHLAMEDFVAGDFNKAQFLNEFLVVEAPEVLYLRRGSVGATPAPTESEVSYTLSSTQVGIIVVIVIAIIGTVIGGVAYYTRSLWLDQLSRHIDELYHGDAEDARELHRISMEELPTPVFGSCEGSVVDGNSPTNSIKSAA